jgi:hypothetical protein
MRLTTKPGTLVAFFDFIDNENGLEYTDWSLINGKNGFFVNSPGREPYKNKQNEMVYPRFVRPSFDGTQQSKRHPSGDAFFAEVLKAAEAEFRRISGNTQSAPQPQQQQQTRSAAGPVKHDDLPPW